MTIKINNAGKRFNFEWILKNINYTFESGNAYAILGPNGSGKSTLLQLISYSLSPSSGTIDFFSGEKKILPENIFKHLSISTPYLELVEELTLNEMIDFQQNFKKFKNHLTAPEFIRIADLKNQEKPIRNFSSGMKQRLKLALAVLADVPVVLLDEPTTNLDQAGVEWYLDLMKNYMENRLIIICSNISREYTFCSKHLDVMNYKS
ncbi:MAG: ABC transporter ATP-binding protein [Chitinophagales bacterium]|nr:ABC transporter ATP-binding protein [Chitinophagales bacterium]